VILDPDQIARPKSGFTPPEALVTDEDADAERAQDARAEGHVLGAPALVTVHAPAARPPVRGFSHPAHPLGRSPAALTDTSRPAWPTTRDIGNSGIWP